MSATTASPSTTADDAVALPPRKWKTAIALGIFALVALFVFGLGPDGSTVTNLDFNWGRGTLPIDPIAVPTRATNLVLALIAIAVVVVAVIRTVRRASFSLWWVGLFGFVWVLALIIWIGAGANVPFTWLLTATLALSTPLVFGAMAGLVSERAGVVNIAIEGQLLAGAFAGALVSSVTQNPFIGLIGAGIAGAAVSLILAVFSIKYWVEQVVVGVVINMIVIGLTTFFANGLMADNKATFNSPVKYPAWDIPGLAQIPIIGPLLFQNTLVVYLVFLLVPLLAWALFSTRWGLRARAVGEHPKAADTVGINVNRVRFGNVMLSGVIAGIGGSYFTLGSSGAFTEEVTSGAGYIALAAVIFGRWHPVYSSAAAVLFGFSSALNALAGQVGAQVPTELMAMIPYIVTVLAVVGFVGQSRAPAADGEPYRK